MLGYVDLRFTQVLHHKKPLVYGYLEIGVEFQEERPSSETIKERHEVISKLISNTEFAKYLNYNLSLSGIRLINIYGSINFPLERIKLYEQLKTPNPQLPEYNYTFIRLLIFALYKLEHYLLEYTSKPREVVFHSWESYCKMMQALDLNKKAFFEFSSK